MRKVMSSLWPVRRTVASERCVPQQDHMCAQTNMTLEAADAFVLTGSGTVKATGRR